MWALSEQVAPRREPFQNYRFELARRNSFTGPSLKSFYTCTECKPCDIPGVQIVGRRFRGSRQRRCSATRERGLERHPPCPVVECDLEPAEEVAPE